MFVNIIFDAFEVNLQDNISWNSTEFDSLKLLIIVCGNSESFFNGFGDFKQMDDNSGDFSLSNSRFSASE